MIFFEFVEYKSKNMQSHELSIHYALKPVIFLGFIFGIDKYSYRSLKIVPKTAASKVYSWFLLCLIIALYIRAINLKLQDKHDTTFPLILDHLANIMTVFSAITSIVFSLFFAGPSTVNYFTNIERIDRLLGLPSECFVKMRTNVILILFLLLSYVSSVLVADALTWDGGIIITMSAMYVSMCVMDFFMFQYVLDIWIVTYRLRAMVSLLIYSKNLRTEKANVDLSPLDLGSTKSWSETNWYLCRRNNSTNYDETIYKLTSIYDKLADNVDLINSSYGFQVNNIYKSTR